MREWRFQLQLGTADVAGFADDKNTGLSQECCRSEARVWYFLVFVCFLVVFFQSSSLTQAVLYNSCSHWEINIYRVNSDETWAGCYPRTQQDLLLNAHTSNCGKCYSSLFWDRSVFFITGNEYYLIFTLLCVLFKACLQGRRQPLECRKLHYILSYITHNSPLPIRIQGLVHRITHPL